MNRYIITDKQEYIKKLLSFQNATNKRIRECKVSGQLDEIKSLKLENSRYTGYLAKQGFKFTRKDRDKANEQRNKYPR